MEMDWVYIVQKRSLTKSRKFFHLFHTIDLKTAPLHLWGIHPPTHQHDAWRVASCKELHNFLHKIHPFINYALDFTEDRLETKDQTWKGLSCAHHSCWQCIMYMPVWKVTSNCSKIFCCFLHQLKIFCQMWMSNPFNWEHVLKLQCACTSCSTCDSGALKYVRLKRHM